MARTDRPPVSRVGGSDGSAAHVFACPPLFAEQVRWLLLTSRPSQASWEQVVAACPNFRSLHILTAAMDFPLLTGPAGARALAGVESFRLQTVALPDLSAAGFVRVVDGLVGHMPALQDLTLKHSAGVDPTPSEDDSAAAFLHINRLALQRYEISHLFVHAGLPLLGSQDCLRELHITLRRQDSAAAHKSLLDVLGRVTLRRLRHLALVIRGVHLHTDIAPHLLAACSAARTLELGIWGAAPEAPDWLDRVLIGICGLGISSLHVSSSMQLADETVKILTIRVLRMRMLRRLVLQSVPPSDDADGERLSRTCRLRRISFIHKPGVRLGY